MVEGEFPLISVIIPVYNRKDNLHLALKALELQSNQDFEVIIADDGSDDGVQGVIEYHARTLPAICYYWQKHKGFRAALARNMAARLARGSALLFIDSDILLNPVSLSHYANIHSANPEVIVAGRYDWLPPMRIQASDIISHWDKIVACTLPREHVDGDPVGIIGPDPRVMETSYLFNSSSVHRQRYCLKVYSGNLLVPAKTYWALGGFDEDIVGHGGEDCEFAIRAELVKIPVIFSDEVIGYHVYHWRNQNKNRLEIKKNVAYITRKHDLEALGIAYGVTGELALVYKEERRD